LCTWVQVICGPSGVGKGTLIDLLIKAHGDRLGFSVSHTTRSPRPGERDGINYHFTTRKTMERDIKRGRFLEHADVHGNFYGTSKEAVRAVTMEDKVCILDIDVQGARSCKKAGLDAKFVFISPPDIEELERRLRGRGTETEKQIQKRMTNAKIEMLAANQPGLFDYEIVNKDKEQAYKQLCSVIFPDDDKC